MDSDSDSSISDVLDRREDEGWEDLEDDTETVTVVSLFDKETFTSAKDMLLSCKENHNFDIWKIKSDLGLDFLELIKLVNYIRSEVASGDAQPSTSDKSLFADDKYLQPVLEDDAVLYSLDDVFEEGPLDSATNEVDQLRDQLAQLTSQFQAYREEVQRSLLEDIDAKPVRSTATALPGPSASQPGLSAVDAGYFESYSFNSIHELMIKDSTRTDAYRDFIYDNKHLFADKVVLDVGCGTGILSMFCAKAGARRVIAVDNSEIIHKARENVFRNKLDNVITCVRGKIEEVILPVQQVDIIVSEWMGYCLLYETMLDSVLFARDKYLNPDTGLMVPSHAVIKIAPLGDSDLRNSHIDFWRDVYGFDMTAMLEKAHEEALIRTLQAEELGGQATTVLELDLHTATVADLSFTKNFSLKWNPSAAKDGGCSTSASKSGAKVTINGTEGKLTGDPAGVDNNSSPQPNIDTHTHLEGFVLWFDTPFATSRQSGLPVSSKWLTLSTGPYTTPTHWQQGVLLIDDNHHKTDLLALDEGDEVTGTISYRKQKEEGSRGLDIEVSWSKAGSVEDKPNGEQSSADATVHGAKDKKDASGRQIWSLE
ncbi:Ribosomal protein arginine N-methyltransferase rmt3 [Cyphellophora attinorum]|uniref:type I protein arginine methyltransferase n=1 Tax=Cyphellophora attinorum TaxID=1664694 RepID=A0A0N0NMQ0_9EURO|nr:Ribosomal protein arginine N-methyltransferase rmt3 [Phialophora attinorum]KPI40608.1 Ribosomal protein arginine N-methyltransferase rmt3 [Phialophora attinorum]